MTKMISKNGKNGRFIWENGGKKAYKKLIGNYLAAPRWTVRFAKFVGDIKDRKEEYRVQISHNGKPIKIRHIIPEHWKGKYLNEKEARKIAENKIKSKYNIDINSLKEISASPSKKPNRRDWTFEYRHKLAYPLEKGEARISISIAGENVINTQKYIHIPENWIRTQRKKDNLKSIFGISSVVIFVFIFISALWIGIRKWKNEEIDKKLLLKSSIFLFILSISRMIFKMPDMFYEFKTAIPFFIQLFKGSAMAIIGQLLLSFALGIIVAFIFRWQNDSNNIKPLNTSLIGFSIGTFIMGLKSVINIVTPKKLPLWADFSTINSFSPLIVNILSTLFLYVVMTAIIYYIILAVEYITKNWERRKFIGGIYFLVIGFILKSFQGYESFLSFLIGGLVMGGILILISYLVFRYNTSTIPFITGGFIILNKLQNGLYQAYPNAFLHSLITVIVLFGFIYFISKKIVFNR